MKAIALLLVCTLLGACDSAEPSKLVSEGNRAIGSGDFEVARSKFSAALESLKAGDSEFLDASLGLVEALITTDPAMASQQFLALADACPNLVGEKQYNYIGGQMVSARKYLEAISLLEVGIVRSGGESPVLMMQVGRIQKEAAHIPAVRSKLEGLGYGNF
ncbi:MAG TPA: hypothetical protein VK843_05020 [Planctomycetota bacterium]|nr:hypothetical protein [Planctomycetota bacterium]